MEFRKEGTSMIEIIASFLFVLTIVIRGEPPTKTVTPVKDMKECLALSEAASRTRVPIRTRIVTSCVIEYRDPV
jgi:hypothetical protein